LLHLKTREMQRMHLKNVKAVLFVDQKSMLSGLKEVVDTIIVAAEMTDAMNVAEEDILQEIVVPGNRTDMMIETGIIGIEIEEAEAEALPEADLLEEEANHLVIVAGVAIGIEIEKAELPKNEMDEKILRAAEKEVKVQEIEALREREKEV